MRSLKKNQRKLYYATYNENITEYDTDGQGNIICVDVDGVQVPVEIGTKAGYNNPVSFYANVSAGKGSAEIKTFGESLDFSRVISTTDKSLPIDNLSLIWLNSEPTYNDDGTINSNSADYKVKGIADSLNSLMIAIKELPKGSD